MPNIPNLSSLWDLSVGESALVEGVEGDKVDAASQRLRDIGFREGQRATCLVIPGFGAPRVFAVGGATYSLDRAAAERVKIREPES